MDAEGWGAQTPVKEGEIQQGREGELLARWSCFDMLLLLRLEEGKGLSQLSETQPTLTCIVGFCQSLLHGQVQHLDWVKELVDLSINFKPRPQYPLTRSAIAQLRQ